MSQSLYSREFYPNLVRAALAGNGVTMAGSLLARFSHDARLLLPFGSQGFGPLGDVVFNSCWIFAMICMATILWQSDSRKRRSRIHRYPSFRPSLMNPFCPAEYTSSGKRADGCRAASLP